MALAQLRLAPQAGRSNDASRRQGLEASAQVGHEAVARVLSRGDRRQAKALGHAHRNVLRGVHGKIRPPVLERGLELLDEKALAADLGEGRSTIWSPRVVIPRMLTSQCGYRRLSWLATCSDCHIASRLLRDAMTIRSEVRLNSRP